MLTRRIIDGKLYDTDKAECVASYDYDLANDLYYIIESLYIKKTGEWFFYGEGGPGTEYGVPCGNNWRECGATIIPFTAAEAQQWLAKKNFVDEYIEYFGEPEE